MAKAAVWTKAQSLVLFEIHNQICPKLHRYFAVSFFKFAIKFVQNDIKVTTQVFCSQFFKFAIIFVQNDIDGTKQVFCC